MIIIAYILIALGAAITFLSGPIATKILKDKREPNEADIVYTKLVGFACILASVLMIFI